MSNVVIRFREIFRRLVQHRHCCAKLLISVEKEKFYPTSRNRFLRMYFDNESNSRVYSIDLPVGKMFGL